MQDHASGQIPLLRTLKAQRWPVLELHAQGQATCGKDFLDFVERLATQIGRFEKLVFGALDEIADVVDVFGLEAVGRANRKLGVVDRTQQHGVDLRRTTCRSFVRIANAFQCSKHRDLVHQDAGRLADSFFRRQHAVGFDIKNQLVEVGTLLDTSAFNRVADAANRAVRGIKNDTTDSVRTVVGQCANVTGHISASLLDLDMDFELSSFGKRSNHVIGVDDLDVVRQFDIGGRDDACAFFAQNQGNLVAVVQLRYHALKVKQNVDDVLTHASDGGVFVHHTGDLHFGGRIAGHG